MGGKHDTPELIRQQSCSRVASEGFSTEGAAVLPRLEVEGSSAQWACGISCTCSVTG